MAKAVKKVQQEIDGVKATKKNLGMEDNPGIKLANLENFELPNEKMKTELKTIPLLKVVKLIKKEQWVVPKDFQRDEIYTDAQKNSLLETIFSKKPIPILVLYQVDRNENVYYIVDGQQRLSAIRDGLNGEFVFRFYSDELKDLNGYTFDELPEELKDDIKALSIRVEIISGVDVQEVQRYYTLLNSTSVPLSPGELCYAIPDPAHKFFKDCYDMALMNNVWNYSRQPKWLLIARLFYLFVEGDLKHHQYIGVPKVTILRYFNSVDEHKMSELWNKVRHLLNTVNNNVGDCALPHGVNQMFNLICAIGTLNENVDLDVERLRKVLTWTLEKMKQPHTTPAVYRGCIDVLNDNLNGASAPKVNTFVTTFERLYELGDKLWEKS